MVEQIVHLRFGFTHGEAADGKAVEILGADFFGRAPAQVFEKAALHNAKEQIAGRARPGRRRGPGGPSG